jgi:hypothetical protein
MNKDYANYGQRNSERAVARTDNTGLAKVAVQCSADTFVVNHPDSYRDGSPHKSAIWRMVKIATFAKYETAICHILANHNS